MAIFWSLIDSISFTAVFCAKQFRPKYFLVVNMKEKFVSEFPLSHHITTRIDVCLPFSNAKSSFLCVIIIAGCLSVDIKLLIARDKND